MNTETLNSNDTSVATAQVEPSYLRDPHKISIHTISYQPV